MIGRRAVVGLSFLCALLFCAFAAQSASAASATNTTAFTCVKGGTKDFTDAHCDKKVEPGKGEFGHEVIALNTKTEVSVTNEKTKNETKESSNAVQKGTVFGTKTEITCTKVGGSGTLTNEEPAAKQHNVTGEITAEFTGCTVNKPAGLGCKVKEPIATTSKVEGVEGLGAGKNEMGLEFKPTGAHFTSIVIESCFLKGTYNVDGTAIGTGTPAPTEKHSGATNVFTNAMTKETLKLAGNAAELESTTTVTMKGGGNPISLTTVT